MAESPETAVEKAVREKDGIISNIFERGRSGLGRSVSMIERAIGRPLDRQLVLDVGLALEQQLYQQGSGEGSEALSRLKAVAAEALSPEKAAAVDNAIDRAGRFAVNLRDLSAAGGRMLNELKGAKKE